MDRQASETRAGSQGGFVGGRVVAGRLPLVTDVDQTHGPEVVAGKAVARPDLQTETGGSAELDLAQARRDGSGQIRLAVQRQRGRAGIGRYGQALERAPGQVDVGRDRKSVV